MLDELIKKNCFFFACPTWIYADSIDEATTLWGVANQIYLRPRRHQTLSFILPFLICELHITSSKQFLRLVIIYGDDVSRMIGSINHFMKQEKGIKAWATQLNAEPDLNSIGDIGNRLLEKNYLYDFASFFRYEEPHHKTIMGHWERVALISPNSLNL